MHFNGIRLFIFFTLVIQNLSFAEDPTLGSTGIQKPIAEKEFRMNQLNGLNVRSYGPNCWNAALTVVGITKAPRAVTKPEMWHYLNSNHCRRLAPFESPESGDIGSLFWRHQGNYHSYVHVDGNVVFSKNGPSPGEVYRFQPFTEMFYPQYKEMASRCNNLTSGQTLQRDDCEMKTVYHRCKSLPLDFYSRHHELKNIAIQVAQSEEIIRSWILAPSESPGQILDTEIALVSLAQILKKLRALHYESDLEFARKSLEYQVIGIFMSDSFDRFSAEVRDGERLADQIQMSERSHIPEFP